MNSILGENILQEEREMKTSSDGGRLRAVLTCILQRIALSFLNRKEMMRETSLEPQKGKNIRLGKNGVHVTDYLLFVNFLNHI